jgi:hypothetical protein
MKRDNDTLRLRIDTLMPGEDEVTVHVSPRAAMNGVEEVFSEAGLVKGGDLIELSEPAILEAAASMFAVGAPLAVVVGRALKEWWHRNDGKRLDITINGEHIVMEGMSQHEVSQVFEKFRAERDRRWREQFPDRWSDEDEKAGE